jgi:hypothetical protein
MHSSIVVFGEYALTKRINLAFDSMLERQNVISCSDFSCVHRWVEDYLKLRTWYSRDADINVEEVQTWIAGECGAYNPELLTDYLRVALGHILLSSLSAGFTFENEYKLLKSAFETFFERGYHCISADHTALVTV